MGAIQSFARSFAGYFVTGFSRRGAHAPDPTNGATPARPWAQPLHETTDYVPAPFDSGVAERREQK
jgi:hypothetical protein